MRISAMALPIFAEKPMSPAATAIASPARRTSPARAVIPPSTDGRTRAVSNDFQISVTEPNMVSANLRVVRLVARSRPRSCS